MNLRVAAPVLAIALSLVPAFARAASLQLQGLCASQARAAFKSGGWETGPLAGFINHYDDTSNKCFVAILFTTSGGESLWRNVIVIDANEGTTYATYFGHTVSNKEYVEATPMECRVTNQSGEDIQCHSNAEFDKMIYDKFGLNLK